MTKTILGLSGSLRRASFNAGLLRAAADLLERGQDLRGRTVDLLDRRGELLGGGRHFLGALGDVGAVGGGA